MFRCIFFILFVSAIQTAVEAVPKCTGLELVTCAFLVDGDKTTKNGMAENEAELLEKCKQSLPILKCLNDFAINCPHSELERLSVFFQEEYKMFNRICDKNDPIQKKYLANAECINKHRKKTEKKCGALLEFEEAEVFNKNHCDAYQSSYKCAENEIGKNCGKVTVEFEKEIWSPVTKFMDNVCSEFQPAFIKYVPEIRQKYSIY
ncbi:uncharacterized protein [Parasteatoda tepidariorum]|uniref:uncharacterized protein isoform X1 n=1 Tax=Parasteatoda tepidariorum TaxID=114398 RepID=UPI001C71898F|nr:uncharacterized protein LOC107450399 isoform X1 [Parasteatoda tepidariorum]